ENGSVTQLTGGMREYQYSSIMDYGLQFNTDIQGLGRYDEAAIIYAYTKGYDGNTDAAGNPVVDSGYVEVFTDEAFNEAKLDVTFMSDADRDALFGAEEDNVGGLLDDDSFRVTTVAADHPQAAQALALGADGHSYLLTALQAQPAPMAFMIALDLGPLTCATPEAGLLVELYLPDEALTDKDTPEPQQQHRRLVLAIADLLQWKFNLPTQAISDGHPRDPDLSGQLDADLGHGVRILIRGLEPPPTYTSDDAPPVGHLIATLEGVTRFAHHTNGLLSAGVSIWETVGLPDPDLLDRLPAPPAPAPIAEATPPEVLPLPEPEQPSSLRPDLKNLWDDIGGFKAPAPPEPTRAPNRAQQARTALYNATQSQKPDDDPFAQDPMQIIKNLGADIALADVYLRSTGYNHAKLAQIMAVYLEMERSDAMTLIEQAPCILRSGIPRDRARSIRQVLEGTGAKITLTRHGEEL
ncbi:MAG: hypothetical protein AAFX99_23290, partial [Myxococcota bacterium]